MRCDASKRKKSDRLEQPPSSLLLQLLPEPPRDLQYVLRETRQPRDRQSSRVGVEPSTNRMRELDRFLSCRGGGRVNTAKEEEEEEGEEKTHPIVPHVRTPKLDPLHSAPLPLCVVLQRRTEAVKVRRKEGAAPNLLRESEEDRVGEGDAV